jgi:hypothetical protein
MSSAENCNRGLWIEEQAQQSCPDTYERWRKEDCTLSDEEDDEGENPHNYPLDPVTNEPIPPQNLIRLRVNGILECYDIRTLMEWYNEAIRTNKQDRVGYIVSDPLTGVRFSPHQLQRIKDFAQKLYPQSPVRISGPPARPPAITRNRRRSRSRSPRRGARTLQFED